MSCDLQAGARMFMAKCAQCHTAAKGDAHKTGPNLGGLFGRTSGTAPGFSFTAGMQQQAITWDEDSLYLYLENPRKFVPGTKMVFSGMPTNADRTTLIGYLKKATG